MDGIFVAGFIAAAVGGLESPIGAVCGGLLIGLAEQFILVVLVTQRGATWRNHHPRGRPHDSTAGPLHQDRGTEGLVERWKRSFAKSRLTLRLIGVIALTALTLAITIILPPVANSDLAGGAAIAVVILGLSWLIGWSGQISLGNSGFMAVGAYAAGMWAHHHTTTPLIFTLALGDRDGGVSGLIIAIPSTRLRGPYLAGITLAFSAAVTPIAQNFTSITGGEGGIFMNSLTTPGWFGDFFQRANASINANAQWTADLAVVVAGVTFFFMANLFHSRMVVPCAWCATMTSRPNSWA